MQCHGGCNFKASNILCSKLGVPEEAASYKEKSNCPLIDSLGTTIEITGRCHFLTSLCLAEIKGWEIFFTDFSDEMGFVLYPAITLSARQWMNCVCELTQETVC